MDPSTCLELALEGERLCKAGDFKAGVSFLEAAVHQGTDDPKVLSAIYSQLGNAYFYLGNYAKALEYHQLDLSNAKKIKDLLGEAKASGNLGNTLKMMGRFDEAIQCCDRHLVISREEGDRIGEGRALYNLGNVYHAKGKHTARACHQDPGEFPLDVRNCLQSAVECYEKNLELMKKLEDRSAQGRAYGNLGNTHYLLGNFRKAITYHEERLKIAKEFGDKAAERRAYSNLGNAHIFLGEFEKAAEYYKKTLFIAQELSDRAIEAQACYSLGNTYTLIRDFPTAIEYHLRHLQIAQELKDRIGEGRAYWSLGNAHCSMGNHREALHYATRHLEISKELGDQVGQATAQMSIADLKQVLESDDQSNKLRRVSMEQMNLLKLTPDTKATKTCSNGGTIEEEKNPKWDSEGSSCSSTSNCRLKVPQNTEKNLNNSMDQDDFFELLSEFQSNRMDDQRCSITPVENKENLLPNGSPVNTNFPSPALAEDCRMRDDLFEMIVGMQSRRMDEQRTSLPHLPGLATTHRNNNNNNPVLHHHMSVGGVPEDDFFDMLMRCQGSRLEDQRSSMPSLQPSRAPTVPDDDFFSLILRVQAGRIDDQRTAFQPQDPVTNTTSRGGLKGSLKSALKGASRSSKSK